MARYGGWRPGDREMEPTIVVPNPTIYVVGEDGNHKPLPRVRERVQPITRGRRERVTYGIDPAAFDAPRPQPAPPVVIRRVE